MTDQPVEHDENTTTILNAMAHLHIRMNHLDEVITRLADELQRALDELQWREGVQAREKPAP